MYKRQDGSPKIEADTVDETPSQETPEQYEERTGYQLPEGYHYVLDAVSYTHLDVYKRQLQKRKRQMHFWKRKWIVGFI